MYDATAPTKPSGLALGSGLSATDNDSTPTITVTVAETGGSVKLYSDSGCSTAASGAATVTDNTSPYAVDVTATALSSDGAVTFYAKHTDAATNASACSTESVSYTYDGTAPSVTYTPGHIGGDVSGSTVTLNPGNKLLLKMAFDEAIDTSGSNEAPKVQFKHGSSNADFGSEVTAVSAVPTAYLDTSSTTDDTDSDNTNDPIDFGSASGATGITAETLGNGYVYKVDSATPELHIRVTANFAAGAALVGRWATSKPGAGAVSSHGTQMWSSDSGEPVTFAEGNKTLTNVAAGTYLWFYPSAARTTKERTLFIAGGSAGVGADEYSTGLLSTGDVGSGHGTTGDPHDFGEMSDVDFITREAVGSGFVYKVTRAIPSLTITARGKYTSGSALVGRWHTSTPTAATVASAGTEMWNNGSNSGRGGFVFGTKTLTNVAANTYFWIYPSATSNRTLNNRVLTISAKTVDASNPVYVASYTTISTDPDVTAGNLKYDVTNETSVKDAVGNNIAAVSETVITGYAFDKTLTGTVGTVPSGKATSKDIGISSVTDGATVKYKLITNATCNSTNYGSGGTAVTISGGSGTVTVTNESDNSKYVCFQITKTNFTTKYAGSTQITGIDDTAPTVTSGSTTYHEGFTVSTRVFGAAASGAYKAGDDIYTKVTFSEDMTQTVGTGGRRSR